MNRTWLDRNRHVLFLGSLLVTLIGIGWFYWRQPSNEPVMIIQPDTPVLLEATSEPTAAPTDTPTPAPVRVYISGAVVQADVYVLPQGSIVKDAVMAAGGFTEQADPVRINLAMELQDQQHIHIPAIDEENPPPLVQNTSNSATTASVNFPSTGPETGLVNINTASLEALDTLPGIGPAIAQRIIDYRQSIGKFQSVEEITQVSGIGSATLEKIKGLITVE